MKNRVMYILLIFFVNFSFINYVYAEEEEDFSFSMTATASVSEVVVGEETTISVQLKSDSAVSSCKFSASSDSSLELVSKNGLNGWNFSADAPLLTITNNSTENEIYTDGKNIFSLVYRVNSGGTISINSIECTNSSNVSSTYQNLSVPITSKEVVNDTTLSSLSVTSGKLLSEFSPNVYEYQVSLDNSKFGLELTANNPEYQNKIVVTDIGGNILDPNNITYTNDGGQNLMKITIVINGNSDGAYTLIAEYKQKELDNSLASLKIAGRECNLNEYPDGCVAKVGKDVNEVLVEATLKDSTNFSFREGNAPGTYSVSVGTTSIALIVEPKNPQIGAEGKTYFIDIEKEEANIYVEENPPTGNILKFVIAFILMVSFAGSMILYKKNMEGYR